MHNLKVVVFGRGHGESILVEFSADEWMVVDCFNKPGTNIPAPLTYLEDRGLSPEKVLKIIVISHFHADHINGMCNLIKAAATDAIVYMPTAFSTKEAFHYYSSLELINGYDELSGLKELNKIVEYMQSCSRKITKLKQDQVIYNGNDYQISALSPSEYDCDKSQELFIKEISRMSLDDEGDKILPLSATKSSHNHYCIVLNILSKKDNYSVLLGSDLEVNKKSGWVSAMNSHMAPAAETIQLFKIPHHGSETGYHKDIWNNYVVKNPIAILTTFEISKLPRDEYINIYKSHTDKLYATTKPKTRLTSVLSEASLKIIKSKGGLDSIKSSSPIKSFGYIETLHSVEFPELKLFEDALLL